MRQVEVHRVQKSLLRSTVDIVKKVGTPVYVYDRQVLVANIRELKDALSPLNTLMCYALKANANMALLQMVAREGCGADVVSGGELFMARRAGIPPRKIVFAGVGKSREEIRQALKTEILMFNVESLSEAVVISEEACATRKTVEVALRVNPDVDSKSHHFISTGKKETKFGIAFDEVRPIIREMCRLPRIRVVGLHVHIGSQIVSAAPFQRTVKKMLWLKDQLANDGIVIKRFDLGGGLGIRYADETPQSASDYAKWLVPLLKPHSLEVIVEPGRFLVGNAGVLVTKVLYRKQSHGKKFLIVDAGMNDLLRPCLYGAYHEIVPLCQSEIRNPQFEIVDVVGPVCETTDFFAKARRLPMVREGDFLAIMSAGAYGYSMSSNYNMRVRPAEVLVDGDRWQVIRKRETYQDLLRGQR